MGFWLEQSETGYAELLMRLPTEDAAREAFVDVVDNGQQDLFTTEAALVDQTANWGPEAGSGRSTFDQEGHPHGVR